MRLILAICAAALLTSGCAQLTHLTRQRTIDSHGTLLIDAKQRAIHSYKGKLCAEPSPDALSALAAQSSTNLTTGKGLSAAQAFSLAEAAGSIGLRTQSIQLLRDHMYRVCESYQAGMIDQTMTALLHRRFQTTTVAILAIEQLTGAVRAPSLILGSSAASGNADAVIKLVQQRDVQRQAIEQSKQSIAEKKALASQRQSDELAKKAEYDSATVDEIAAKQTAYEKAVADRKKADGDVVFAEGLLADREAGLTAIDRAMSLAQASGSASATGSLFGNDARTVDMAAVSSAVENIVKATFAQSNIPDLCLALLSSPAMWNVKPTDGSTLMFCQVQLVKNQMLLGQ